MDLIRPRKLYRIQPTYPEAREAVRHGARSIADTFFAPRQRVDVLDWVEQNIVLPPSSPRAGFFQFDYTPYLRGILKALTSPTFTYGAVVKSGQLGFSVGVLCNYIGYVMSTKPESIALMLPAEQEAIKFSKDKIRNLIERSPAVLQAFGGMRARDPDNAMLMKRTRAGTFLTLLGSNSTAATRSSTTPVLLFDEVDEYESDEEQGDIIKLMMRAQMQFGVGRKKVMLGSTPTVWIDAPDGDEATREERGHGSRSYREFLDGDRREWWCTCPSCGDRFILDFFRHVRWPKEGTVLERAAAAEYVCPQGCALPRSAQREIVGQEDAWAPSRPEGTYPSWNIRGELSFAPGMQINELALELMTAGKDPVKLRPFYNLKLGRVFKELRSPIVVQTLRDRRELYPAEVPAGVGVLTCQVDVQRGANARLEVLITGWGVGEESWRIHHYRLMGDVAQLVAKPGEQPTPWQRLDAILQRHYVHEAGVGLRISRTVIDSADGEMTDIVYKYAKARTAWGVVPIRGLKAFGADAPRRDGRPELVRAGKASDSGVRLILMDTYALKDRLFSRLRLTGTGPGTMHWPLLPDDSGEFPFDYWGQFKNESKVARRKHKHSIETVDVYEQNGPVESVDLEVMGMAALYDWGADNLSQLPQLVARVQAQGAASRIAPTPIAAAPTEAPSRVMDAGRPRGR
jgi:phage terminase large subunit GpA-like protein